MGNFVDVQGMARLRPRDDEVSSIAVGNGVKVSICGERFWVRVIHVEGDVIVGVVDGDLILSGSHGLFCGDVVRVHKNNVFDVCDL
jgi:hypothetical protein